MRYIRQFTRKQERNQTKTIEQQKHDLDLARKVLTAVTAFSFIGNPFAAMASTITRVDGAQGGTIEFNNNVANIYAEQMLNGNQTAINRFDKFDVSANDIANMYFKTNGSKDWANNLVNFVNSRIDVAGTVNAIKDSKIGGNLFFLSSDGMAVTGRGVINAGSLTIMTPTTDAMEYLLNPLTMDNRIRDFVANPSSIPINSSGTISIEGTVNTLGDIRVFGGRNVNVAGTLQTSQAPAVLPANVFKDTVNVGDNATMSWGDLNAEVAGNGDIILSAQSSVDGSRTGDSSAAIDISGKLAGHDITLAATSQASFESSGYSVGTGDLPGGDNLPDSATMKVNIGQHLGEVGLTVNADAAVLKNNASITIQDTASLDATGAVDIAAQSTVEASIGIALPTEGSTVSVIPAASVTYADVENTANVTINGEVNAADDVSAVADASTDISASSAATIDEAAGTAANIGYAAVTVVNNTTSAAVNINKDNTNSAAVIHAGGALNIDAAVTNSLESSAEAATSNLSALATAVNIVTSKGNAEVNVGLAELQGDSVAIHAQNTLDGNAITADNGVGDAPPKSWTGRVDAITGAVDTAETLLGTFDSNDSSFLSTMLNNAISQNLSGVMGKDPTKAMTKTLGKYLDVGASIAVVDETNTAAVNLNQAVITATVTPADSANPQDISGTVDIAADTIIRGSTMNVSGSVTSGKSKKKNNGKTNIAVDAAVLVSNMDNTAAVVTKDVNIGGQNVNIASATKMEYNINSMIEDMQDAIQDLIAKCDAVEGSFKDWSALKAQLENDVDRLNDLYLGSDQIGDETTLNELFSGITSDLVDIGLSITNSTDDIVSALGDRADTLVDVKDSLTAIKDQAFTFADPGNYLNYYVRTSDASSLGSKPGGSGGSSGSGLKLSLAGSVDVSSVRNNASTVLGEGTRIVGNKGTNITSDVVTETISITGNANELLKKKKKGGGSTTASGTSIGAGGSVAVQDISNNSLVMIGKNAVIGDENSENLHIKANNEMTQTGVVYNAGEVGTVGLEGMVNLLNGGSNSLVSIDDEAIMQAAAVELASVNDSTLTAVSGGATLGKDKTTASIGAGATLTLYDVNNIVVVGDNGFDTDVSADEEETKDTKNNAEDKRKIGVALAQSMTSDSGVDIGRVLGNKTTETDTAGAIYTDTLTVSAQTSGLINSVAVEAVANTSSKKSNSALSNLTSATGGGQGNPLTNQITSGINSNLSAVNNTNLTPAANVGGSITNGGQSGRNITQNTITGSGATDSVNVAGAGSVAVNMLAGETGAIVDGITVYSSKDGGVDVSATDSLFSGAWAGAGAVNWFGKTGSGSTSGGGSSSGGTEVSIGGAAGVSIADRGVSSIISNSAIKNAGHISNKAAKDGAEVAVGLGLAVAKGSTGSTDVGVAASVSYNEADNDIYALMVDNKVDNTDGNTTLMNSAYNADLQITGGLSMAAAVGGKTSVAGAGSVAISDIDTDLESGLSGGSYENMGEVAVEAAVATKQISAAVGAAISTGTNSNSFSGAVGYNTVTNQNRAFIEDAEIVSDDTVSVKAYDTDVDSNEFSDYLTERGVDVTGTTGTEADANIADGGSLIVNVAASVAAGSNSGVGAAVNISNVDNSMNADIIGSQITANTIAGQADTKTQIISVAGGLGDSQKFGGAGSVSWDTLSNNNIVTLEDNEIHADNVNGTAQNQAHIVNVAGQLSAGQNGAGLALAYNSMDNMTGVYVNGGSISGIDGWQTRITLNADNDSHIMAIGAGVTAASGVAVNGSIAINQGANSTEAVIGNTDEDVVIENAADISVTATDDSKNTTGAGGISASAGTAAVGGAVAYSDIGGSSGNAADAGQHVRAEINHAEITTVKNSSISLNAADDADIDTFALGTSFSSNVAVQGAAAASLINKTVAAGMKDTSIQTVGSPEGTNADGTADVNIHASNTSDIDSYAVVAAASGTTAAGIGIGVNRIVQQTDAFIQGGVQNVANANLTALGQPKITATGVGASASGSVSIGGSVGINMVENNVTAGLRETDMHSTGNIGVVAQSDEQIENYAGALSASGAVAVGATVAVNTVSGDTAAYVEDSQVTAEGNTSDTVQTHSGMDDNSVISDALSDSTAYADALLNGRQDRSDKGLVVDSSATHSISSILGTVGASGTVAASGTVNVNSVGGSTAAYVNNTVINADLADTAHADVAVRAADYTNSSGMTVAASASGTAAVGAASDTALVNRVTEAAVDGGDTSHVAKAHDFSVQAVAEQGISHFTAGAAVGGITGVAGTVLVDKLQSQTQTTVNNMNINYNGKASVTAEHEDGVYVGQVSAAGGTVGVGLTVNVVNQNSTVGASVTDSEIISDHNDSSVEVKAENINHLNSTLASVGGGIAGVTGVTTVNNMRQTVGTTVADSTLQGGSIDVLAKSSTSANTALGNAAGGGGGFGASVSVNTFDDAVSVSVTDSTLTASTLTAKSGDVSVLAEEERDIEQTVINAAAGGVAAGANIMVTTVNGAIGDEDTLHKINEANSSGTDYTSDMIGLSNEEIEAIRDASAIQAGTGGDRDDAGVHVSIARSEISAAGKVDVGASEANDVTMTGGSGAAGAASASASVGILDVKHQTGVAVEQTDISGDAIAVIASQGDVSDGVQLNLYQGTAGWFGTLGGTYAGLSTSGMSAVTINGGSMTARTIDIAAKDASSAAVDSWAVRASPGVTAGVLVAEAENDSDTAVRIENSAELKSDSNKGAISITSDKSNTVAAAVHQVSGGLVTGSGMAANVADTGSSVISIGDNNLMQAKALHVAANNISKLNSSVLGVSGGLLASAAVNVASVNSDTETKVILGDNNIVASDDADFAATANISQQLNMVAVGISGYAALSGNTTTSEVDSNVAVEAGVNTYKGYNTAGGNVAFKATNTTSQNADTSGVSAAGLFATGTNIGSTTSNLSTAVNLLGSRADSDINNFDATANSYASIINRVNGDGGAIADISPYAAMVENNYTADTDVTLSGTWNTTGSFTAQALNGMDVDLKSDAVRAAVVGGSGTWLNNVLNNAANVIIDNANITTDGAQRYIAQNQVDYVGEIDGSGYGGINVNATDYADDLDFTAGVDIKNSALTGAGDEGSITAFASTEGTIHSKNSLKSAGVIPVALAFSDHAITYNNSVNVTDSTLTTDKKDQDITLAATDDTDVKLETIADTQGGAVGAASAEASNTFDRSNKINIDKNSELHSTNDIDLYAGTGINGGASSLNLQVLADAYNKTAISLYTAPKITNKMTQSNQVELAGKAESVRHINASAVKGTTTVTESAQEYKIWTGTGGNGSVVSTAFGDTIASETADNYVNVTGTATAGIHNKLDITISGETASSGDKTEMTDVSYDGIMITVGEGSDWFDPQAVQPSDVVMVNGLMSRYNEVVEYLKVYGSNTESAAYKAYAAEKTLLLNEMLKAGFAEETKASDGTTMIVPLESMLIPGIELPDIVVSGGNINIEADSLKGDGSLKAQGAPQLSITNESDLYLKVNNLTISDNGGNVNLGSVGNDLFTGKKESAETAGKTPTISIHGATPDSSSFGGNKHVQADIGVYGDITNTAGNIEITNDNYNILMQGNVNGQNISIKATRGDVTQTNNTGIINVGNDPIANIQFSETVAKQIQEFLYNQKADGSVSFEEYGAYINWLVNTVGVAPADLGISGKLTVADISSTDVSDKVAAYIKDQELKDSAADLIADAKAGGVDSWVAFLKKVGASYTCDRSKLDGIAVPANDNGNKDKVILAGGNVYISGLNVNIGGLVQSGYDNYGTTLNDTAKKKVEDLDEKWQANQVVLDDRDVIGNSAYLVNDGGEKWNSKTGVWDYEVKVYYNPSTGQLLTESVRPDGGQIQISGKISSTGGGRIVAADGTADVHINTSAVERDVKVNSITGSDLSGIITITDKNQVNNGNYCVTEYRNGQYRSYWTGDDTAAVAWKTGTPDYNPVKETQFAWTGGVTGERIEEKTYTEDFLFWGALAYNKSEDLLNHIAQEHAEDDVKTGVITSGDNTESLANGSLITNGYTGGKNIFTIHWSYKNSDDVTATDPHAKKEYDGTAGKIFGYGEYIYTWTETSGDQVASSTGVKADNPIPIGFLGNNQNGDISVEAAKDILLNGTVSNASVVDGNNQLVGKGSVSLTSQTGAIIGNGTINSDDVNLKAAGDINVNHAAIGSGATVNIASDNGDIHFTSSKGDLSIEQAVTGGANPITAETGSVYLEAAGSILDAHTGDYAVKGQRIDLLSHNGSIGALNEDGTVGNEFRILGGSDLYSSDTMASSVNASAKGDIVLTQVDGNMRLGTIASTDGDAVLTVTNGSFVDAHPSENSSSSSAQDKIDRWIESDLISEADTDPNSSQYAAEEAKGERVSALEERMNSLAAEGTHSVDDYKAAAKELHKASESLQDAKNAYSQGYQEAYAAHSAAIEQAGGDAAAIEAADAAYKQAVEDLTSTYLDAQAEFYGDGFSVEEQQLINSYAETAYSENYGWSKNQLLYAIQDTVLNTDPREVQTVETPNVSAKNITLNAASGGIGIDGEAQFISNDALNDVENLKILAAAKAGDLTWSDDGVTVRQQQAITVWVKDKGQVNVTGRDNVYLAGVEGTMLDINDIKTTGDIRLQGDAGIDVNSLKGQDLTIVGGTGSITNSANKDGYIYTDLTGSIDAKAEGTISFESVNGSDLKILAAAVGKDFNLKAAGNILMQTAEGSTAQGRINANTINLKAEGTIGTADTAIRILDNGAVVNATAGDGIWLSGENSTGSKDGSLVIGKIEGSSFDLTSVSNVSLGRADDPNTDEVESLTGSITTTNGNASITAETDIAFAADSLVSVQNGKGTLTLTAEQGSVTQGKGEEDSGIYAGTVDVSSKGSQLLENAQNTVTNFVVRGLEEDNSLTGNVHLVSGAETVHINFSADEEKGLTVNDGSITVHHNGSADGELRVTGSATTKNASSDDSIKTDIVMSSLGSLTSDGALDSAGNVCMDAAGNITQKNSVTAVGEAMFTSDAGSISLTGTTTAGRVEATTESEADEGTITFSGDVTANTGDITVDSNGGAITIGSSAVSEKSYIDLSSETGAITVTGSAKAGGDVTAETKDGSITFGQESTKTGSVTSATGNVTAKTDSGNISVYGTADADKDILFESSVSGTIRVDGTSTAGQHFTAETGSGDIALNGSVKAMDGDVTATSKKGSISTSEDVFAGQNVTVETVSGLIDLGGKVTAKAGAITATTTGNTSGTSGSITLKGDADAAQTITLSSDGGAITVTGSAKADGDVMAETKDGSITFGQEGSADGSVTSESGEVKATTGRGDITIYGTSTAGTDFTAKTDAGDITLDGNITAQTGMVMAQAFSGSISAGGTITSASNTELTATGVATDDSGNITVNGEIASGKEVHASATNGSIRFEGTTTASAGDVTATVSGDGDITFNGAVTAVSEGDARGNIAATVSGTGNITTDRDAVFKADKDIQFTTNVGNITANSAVTAGEDIVFKVLTEGNMTLRDDLKSEQNIDLNVNSGNILFEGTQDGVHEDIYVTSNGGDVTVSINEGGSGVIKDTNSEGPTGDWAHLTSAEGNVTVRHDGIGDVDLYELYAKQDAGVSVANGNLHLVDVSGNLVAVFVKSEGKEMDVENIEAAQQIAISGSNMDLDSIKQREDGDGFLVITPEGTADDQPIDNLVIGDILTNGGVRFDHLWLNTGNIHVSEGALHLDKVYVQDKATFSTDDMTTNVFGSAPVYDDSVSSSYWVNTSINSPKDDLAAWNSDELNDKWMHIFFSPEGTVQISNGNLLHLADHNYVYNQRYSQVDWMNIFTDKDFYNFYDRYYAPELSYHERYGLTSGSGHSVENAEEDEVIVE